MKFIIADNKKQVRILIYRPEEHSLDMEPTVTHVDFDLVINKINLSVVDQKVIQIWGFCGLSRDMISSHEAPVATEGSLVVVDDFKHGFAYSISESNYPVSVNINTGWVCVGQSDNYGDYRAVEFITNCIAVIEKQKLVALWLKPNTLPNLL